MGDERRCEPLIKEAEGIYFDFTRQRVTAKTMEVRMTCDGLYYGAVQAACKCACIVFNSTYASEDCCPTRLTQQTLHLQLGS